MKPLLSSLHPLSIHSPARTGLLLSVRNLSEALSVAPLGVEVLDLKEPAGGALAATLPAVWHAVVEHLADTLPLSVALGEFPAALQVAPLVPPAITFAKAGPAHTHTARELVRCWQALRHALPESVEAVAVAYADFQEAGCAAPFESLQHAADAGLQTWLLDTFTKDGRSTFDFITRQELIRIMDLATASDARLVLAGSLRREHWPQIQSLPRLPDLIGLRGDVCEARRQGNVSPQRVSEWIKLIQQTSD